MSSEQLHENADDLDPALRDRHRAIASLIEELEAVDWYDQRIAAAGDDELAAILRHNRDEEKEHAAMVLEWLRRRDASFAEELRAYLFRDGAITTREEQADGAAPSEPCGPAEGSPLGTGSLGIGSLRAAGRAEEDAS